MLVLTRKSEQSVIVGGNIEIKILSIHGDQVSIGFSAPLDIGIHRKEIYEAIQKQNLQAGQQREDACLHMLRDALNSRSLGDGKTQQKGVMQDNTR